MRKLFLILTVAILLGSLAGCSGARTGNDKADKALTSFNSLVQQNKDRKGFHAEMKHWRLALPDDAKFEWAKDTSASEIDFAMIVPAQPFVDGGLDLAKLADSPYVFKEAEGEGAMAAPDRLVFTYDIGDKRQAAQGSDDAMRRLLKQAPDLVTHDAESKLYGLAFSDGFQVQWTAEPQEGSPQEMIFSLAADPLIEAGLDVDKLREDGWSLSASTPSVLVKTYTLR